MQNDAATDRIGAVAEEAAGIIGYGVQEQEREAIS